MVMPSKRVAITMGDAAGVGPEICLRLLADPQIVRECIPIVIGDAEVLTRVSAATGISWQAEVISLGEWNRAPSAIVRPTVVHLPTLDAASVVPGSISAMTGRASYEYISAAIDAVIAQDVCAVTTGPISKEALHAAGLKFPGHTEIFASRTSSQRSCMMQYSEIITCTFVTVHVGYYEVPELLTTERIGDVIDLTADALLKIRGRAPKMVVCGLNPHAGEHGLFGNREEERVIIPAIAAARARGHQIDGPLPPDTCFTPAKRAITDAFICMYHDQGHIPVKALAFEQAVNTTLGLPVIRTSVDHGTACDIAWQGKADPSSLFAAVRLAVRLADNP